MAIGPCYSFVRSPTSWKILNIAYPPPNDEWGNAKQKPLALRYFDVLAHSLRNIPSGVLLLIESRNMIIKLSYLRVIEIIFSPIENAQFNRKKGRRRWIYIFSFDFRKNFNSLFTCLFYKTVHKRKIFHFFIKKKKKKTMEFKVRGIGRLYAKFENWKIVRAIWKVEKNKERDWKNRKDRAQRWT